MNQHDEWTTMKERWSGCTRCPLHAGRTNLVFGSGDPQRAELVIIGEAPGFHEDQQGEPFVGRAGELLDALLEGIGHPRSYVVVLNVLKCRPPGNRDPEPAEIAACVSLLRDQVRCIQPKVILSLGRFSSRVVLNVTGGISKLRGKWATTRVDGAEFPVMPTYHPAYVLRDERTGGKLRRERIEEDFAMVRVALNTGEFHNASQEPPYQGGPIKVGRRR